MTSYGTEGDKCVRIQIEVDSVA